MKSRIAVWISLIALSTSVSAQISAELIDRHRADFAKQSTDADMKREGGTQSRDWPYALPQGVTTRLVTFYVDGGKLGEGTIQREWP